ncbi:GerAB/ArcD/ProY family transporter [Alteribacillus bidgolensis]|uniref:Spore germination protein KB n=1 Tax=Alteribacillus bidgolensis TaxID=930129 RepID=A0A1G8H754_9BACI|nr:endospore germination permease [Alteribacillus bidgolensis]SDI02379.1 spore germination protein KB [Alteribacillus bidgolensis]
MFDKWKISASQFMILVILFTVGSAILIVPSGLVSDAKQDAWLAAIFGIGIGVCLVILYIALGSLFPDMTLIEVHEKLLGKWLGKAVSLFFITTLFLGGPVTVLFYLGNFMTAEIILETPLLAINIFFAIVVILGVRFGIETLARTAEIVFPWFILLFIGLIIFLSPEMKFENFQPVLERGIKPVIPAILSFLGITYFPLVVLLMIFPSYINHPKTARKTFLIGSFIGSILIGIIVTLCILVLGPSLTELYIYPSYALAKKINIGNFLTRIEVIMAIIWLISLYFRLTIYFYITVVALAKIFNLNDYRPLTLPLGMILVVLSIIVFPDTIYGQRWDAHTWVPYIFTFGFIWPLFLLGVGIFRKNTEEK